jgi:hypothetical protein
MSSARSALDNISELTLKDEEKAVTTYEALKNGQGKQTRQQRCWVDFKQ